MPIVLFFLMIFATKLWAVDVTTSISTVSHEGINQLLGSFTLDINENAFANASPGDPVYIRFTLARANGWSKTLVDLRPGAYAPVNRPINLALSPSANFSLNPAVPPSAVQLVRLIKGERAGWIRVTFPSSEWVLEDGGGSTHPKPGKVVAFTLGITGENSVKPGANTASGGNEDPLSGLLASTRLRADYRNTPNFGIGDIEELDFIAFNSATVGVEAGDNINLGSNTGIGFSNDPKIARGDGLIPCFEYHFQPEVLDGPPHLVGFSRINQVWRELHCARIPSVYLTNSSDFEWRPGSRFFLTLSNYDPAHLVTGEREPFYDPGHIKIDFDDADLTVMGPEGGDWSVKKIYSRDNFFVGYELVLEAGELPIWGQLKLDGLMICTNGGWYKGSSLLLKASAYYLHPQITNGQLTRLGSIRRQTAVVEEKPDDALRQILPFTGHDREDWRVTIQIVNLSPNPATVSGFFYQRQGILTRVISLEQLPGYGGMNIDPLEAYGATFASILTWLELLSDQPVKAIAVIEGKNGKVLDIIHSSDESKAVLYGAHVPTDTELWQTKAYLVASEFDTDSSFELALSGASGQDIKSLRAPRYSTILTDAEFNTASGRSPWFRVDATNKAGSGVFFFERRDNGSQLASLALDTDPLPRWSFDHLGDDRNGWWNGLILVNPDAVAASVKLDALDADGETLAETTLRLEPRTKIANLVGGLIPTDVPPSRLTVESDRPIIAGLLLGRQDQEILTSVMGNGAVGKTFIVPFIPRREDRWLGLAVTNTAYATALVTVTPYQSSGEAGEPREITVPARGKQTFLAGDLFGDLTGYDVLLIESGLNIRVFGITGNEGQLATVPTFPGR